MADDPVLAKIQDVDVADQMQQAYIDYAMSVITARALPDVRDGLLPVQRRILYAMRISGNTHQRGFRKAAKTVGEVIGNFHPHGDVALYGSLVRLAQDFSLRYPLIEGHGNFGSVDGDPPAAMRYTEARLSAVADEMLRDLEKETVDFVTNYDDSDTEPSVLPARFPSLLCNGAIGIAVGMSTSIPPHNLSEVAQATLRLLDHPETTGEELAEIVRGPDFPTGAIIMGRAGIRSAYETGRGTITVRGRAEIVVGKGDRQHIVITEIPFETKKSSIIERIAALHRDRKLEGISAITDASDRHGLRVLVDLQRGVNAAVVLNRLYKETPLQQTYSIRLLALVDGRPRLLSLREILHHYIEHQREVVVRRTRFDLERAQRRAHIVEGLLRALDVLDEIIQLIRGSETREAARDGLEERFQMSRIQAEAILDMRLSQLTGLERHRLESEFAELQETIARLEAILGSDEALRGVIRDELTDVVRRFGDRRRTEIVDYSPTDFSPEDLVAAERVVVTLTRAGYCKRTSLDTYRNQGRGGRGVAALTTREDDFVTDVLVAGTHDHMLFFTSLGRVYRLRVFELPEAGRTARGTAVVNLLPLGDQEKVTAVIPVSVDRFAERVADEAAQEEGESGADSDGGADEEAEEAEDDLSAEGLEDQSEFYIVLATQRGRVKRVRLRAFASVRKNGLLAIGLEGDDRLADVRICQAGDRMLLVTQLGQAVCFPVREVRSMGRTARGVGGIRLAPADSVVGMVVAERGLHLAIVSANGVGKRTPIDDFPCHHRGTTGVRAQRLTNKTGPLVGVRPVRSGDEIMLITAQGKLIRQGVDGIPSQGRSASGVWLMRPESGDVVVAVATVAREDPEDAGAGGDAGDSGE